MRIVYTPGLKAVGSHVYQIGGNPCSFFALGNVGAPDDFWLVGAQIEDSPYPRLYGTILGTDGSVLVRIVDNELTVNPARCERIYNDSREGLSYQIRHRHGDESAVVLQVDTLKAADSDQVVSSVLGKFHGKDGRVAIESTRGHLEFDEARTDCSVHLAETCHANALHVSQGDFLQVMYKTRGVINYILRGVYPKKTLTIDGAYLSDFSAPEAILIVNTSFWMGIPGPNNFGVIFNGTSMEWHPPASFIVDAVMRTTVTRGPSPLRNGGQGS